MDMIDKENEAADHILADALRKAEITENYAVSNEICEDCGEVIPEARRKAVPGVRLCVLCKEFEERGYP